MASAPWASVLKFLWRADFYLDGWEPRRLRTACSRRGNSPGERDMIVLDEDSIGKIEAVILPPPQRTAYLSITRRPGAFLRVSRIRAWCRRRRRRICGEGGDAAHALEKIQDDAFARKKHARVVADDGDGLAFVQAHAIEDFGMRGDFVVRSDGAVEGRRKRRESARCCRCRRECNPVWRGWWRRRADWDRCRRSSWHRAWRGLRQAFSIMAVCVGC